MMAEYGKATGIKIPGTRIKIGKDVIMFNNKIQNRNELVSMPW